MQQHNAIRLRSHRQRPKHEYQQRFQCHALDIGIFGAHDKPNFRYERPEMARSIRLAARAVILHENKLLLVNAWPDPQNPLWCAPGGGATLGQSLPETLIREVHEECGITVAVGAPCLINEFHAPDRDFHQVEVFFRAEITGGTIDPDWQDPEGIVHRRRFFARAELAEIALKPDRLADVAWRHGPCVYDPLERLVE